MKRSESGLTLADVGVPQVLLWVLVVEGFTLVTLVTGCVVVTVVTDAAAGVS